MKRKVCGKCARRRLVKFFAINRAKKGGLNSYCRDCQSKYHRKHYLANKDKYIKQARAYKDRIREEVRTLKLKCARCPETHPAVLEFHHTDRRKKDMAVATMICHGFSFKRILKEIEKCIVLCANCHRKLHWVENAGEA